MGSLRDWARFVRAPNLIIVLVTQCMIRWAVLGPVYDRAGVLFDLGTGEFLFLVLATILVTAGGYLINDLYDTDIDRVNKPDRVYVGRLASVRSVRVIYGLVGMVGGLIAVLLAIRLEYLRWLFLYPLSVAALWAYSARLKRTPLWGNVVVGVFSAGVVALVWLAEGRSMEMLEGLDPGTAELLKATFVFYVAFAFLSTLFRELVKDIEDAEGDGQAGCRTLPIVYGTRRARLVAGSTLALLAAALGLFVWRFQDHLGGVAMAYALAALGAPVLALALGLMRARSTAHYGRLSLGAKVFMLAGLLFLPVIALT